MNRVLWNHGTGIRRRLSIWSTFFYNELVQFRSFQPVRGPAKAVKTRTKDLHRLFRKILNSVGKTLSGAGEDASGVFEVSLALVGVASPAYFQY